MPSTSHTRLPAPRSTKIGHGGASCHDEARRRGGGRGLDVQLVRSPGAGDERRLLDGDQAVEGVEVPVVDLVDDCHA